MSKRDINQNAFFNTVKTIFGIIFPLITFPYISRILGAKNVGRISFASSIVNYVSLIASLGITTYAVRECSKVREDKEKLQSVSSEIFTINIISTIVAYIFMLIVLNSAKSLTEYRMIILIQSITVLFTTLGADWLNTTFEDFKFIAIRTIMVQFMSLVAMFIFVKNDTDYIRYATLLTLASSGANAINIFYREKKCKIRLTRKMNIKRHMCPILLLFSMTLSQTIYVNSDITLLGIIRGDFEVGLYSTSVKLYNLVNSVIASVAWVVMPQISSYYSKKDYVNINRMLKYALNYIIILGVPCFVGVNVIAPQLVETIAGKDYLGAATSLRILSFALAFSLIGGFIGNIIMLPSGREKICLKACIISSVVNFVTNCVLIPKWGLNAAAFTTALAEFVGLAIVSLNIEKEIKFDNIKEIIRAPVIGGSIILLYLVIIKQIITNAYALTFIAILGSFIIYLTVFSVMKNLFFVDIFKSIVKKNKEE